ncbi:hypothetical protein [Actinomadura gamaensis]|uniref:Uncharacterized protein n=1 Tax=Actinomadura gamaensis TaxID=1763541 RepID=A0ABV9U9N9_9ACTN
MSSREHLVAVLDGVCLEVGRATLGNEEVAERLILITDRQTSLPHSAGLDVYDNGGTIAFVNNSGVPFVEQSDDLIRRVAPLRPQAVLLAGSALTGRPGGQYRRVLAVQMFSPLDALRAGRVAEVEPARGLIEKVLPWRNVKAGPPVWAEQILNGN